MANDAGTPSSRKKNRKRRRKGKKMTMTGASLSLTTTGKKTAKTKGHHPWQQQGDGDGDGDGLNHPCVPMPIQPPPPAAARNADEDTSAASSQPRGEQDPQELTAATAVTASSSCRRDTDDDDDDGQPASTCCICGAARWHNEYYCAWNYMDGRGSHACSPGQHQHAAANALLRRFVRVTNLPSSIGQRDLEGLFRRFGPLRTSVITTRLAPPGTAGFGYVAFEEREHAEEAVDELNGHLVDGRKLRVDWAYPRA